MALPNDKRSLQDRLSRVATRMAQKFGNGIFSGVTYGAGASAGIPLSVLTNRIAGKKVVLDNLGRENASALSFTLIDNANGATAATKENLVASTYLSSQFPTGIYGSPTALVMLAKLKTRTDCVDVHVIGDSNGGAPNSGNGWQYGWHRGLIRGCSAPMYATGVFPVMIHPSSNSRAGVVNSASGAVSGSGYQYLNASLFDGATSDNSSQFPNSGASAQSGNLYAPTELKVYFDIKNSPIMMAGVYTADFAWFPNTGLTFYRGEPITATALFATKGIFDTDGIDTRGALTYRVVHSVHPQSTGSFPLFLYGTCAAPAGNAYNAGFGFSFPTGSISNPTSYTQMGKRISVSTQGATGITASFQTWGADTTRVGVTIGFNWYGLGSAYGGTTYSKGPFAVYFESVHGNTIGFAVTGVEYFGGATTGAIANVIENVGIANDTDSNCLLKTLCKETVERQIQAGGSGNLIVFINTGINDTGELGTTESTAIAQYKTQIGRIISSYKTVWESLKYPENDLAFIVATTHPNFLTPAAEAGTGLYDWNLDGVRAEGVDYTRIAPDYSSISKYSNVTFVDITKLGTSGITQGGLTSGNSFNSNTSFYLGDTTRGAHLATGNTGGYAYIAELMVARCLRFNTTFQV